jgi:CBS domain-containing protein
MSSPALTVSSDASLAEAAARMESNQVHRLVVVGPDGASPVGIVSTTDLIHAMLEEPRP